MKITNRTYENLMFKKVYMLWYNMMRRCHNENYPQYINYGAKGVFVSNRWKDLDNFIEDIDSVDGFIKDDFLKGKLVLDKDSKFSGNKEYSLDNCSFITLEENNKIKPNQQKRFLATSPNGEEFIGTNQSKFARNHKLTQSQISHCLSGEKQTHKDWKFKYI